jgi:hypothetical protein
MNDRKRERTSQFSVGYKSRTLSPLNVLKRPYILPGITVTIVCVVIITYPWFCETLISISLISILILSSRLYYTPKVIPSSEALQMKVCISFFISRIQVTRLSNSNQFDLAALKMLGEEYNLLIYYYYYINVEHCLWSSARK